ncbi:hypothetical protein NEF87_003794 [Candidatus Lokiarchaeum ossiferum]|uniref:MFS transporter n=1 Tax=Candidatus Lokiarchaeum ossiferum TaxID=2951803 RepID=A0ABY6HY83_9ARCH|nr:hypothetical protein NEF87_003794 [Candidatus Lokiarchaeum sp. B-35]
MKSQNPQLKSYFSKDFLMVYMIFFWFYMIKEIIVNNFQLIYGINEIVDNFFALSQISIVLLPFVILKLSNKFGNILPVKIVMLFYSLIGLFFLFHTQTMLIYIFILPIITRFVNNSLNPWIIKKSVDVKLSTTFALRDLFMYLGFGIASVVSLIMAGDVKNNRAPIIGSVFIVFFLTFLMLFLKNDNLKNEIKIDHLSEIPNNTFDIKSFKELSNKRVFLAFLIIECLISWILMTSIQLVRILDSYDLSQRLIFSSLSISYLLVGIISTILSLFPIKSENKKKIYLFDLIFDVIPFSMFLLSQGNQIVRVIAIFLLIARDFVKPFSMDYIYSCFDKTEINYVWGIVGVIPALIAAITTSLVGKIDGIAQFNVMLIVSIGLAITCTIVAIVWLPKSSAKDC